MSHSWNVGEWGFVLLLSLGLPACSGNDEPEWEFGQADMERAVYGTWRGTLVPEGGSASDLTLEIRHHDETLRSPACGSRSFSSGEGAPSRGLQCGETTALMVSGTLTVNDGSDPEEFDGEFMVYGTRFDNGDLTLRHRESERLLHGSFQHGTWNSCGVYTPGDPPIQESCTLDARDE